MSSLVRTPYRACNVKVSSEGPAAFRILASLAGPASDAETHISACGAAHGFGQQLMRYNDSCTDNTHGEVFRKPLAAGLFSESSVGEILKVFVGHAAPISSGLQSVSAKDRIMIDRDQSGLLQGCKSHLKPPA